MDKYHLYWFTDEIYLHVASADANYQNLLILLEDEERKQSRIVWLSLFSFLTHTAMVSKLLFPIGSDKAKEARGSDLRGYLDVAKDSPILLRNARDNLEHIDERIDGWVQRGDKKIIEMVFDDRDGFNYICKDDGAVRRVLIMDEMVFISEDRSGQRIETALVPIHDALKILLSKCTENLAKDMPYSLVLAKALRAYKS